MRRSPGLQRCAARGFSGCFSGARLHVRTMSLNRCEQRVFDYLQGHAEERHFWQAKVQSACRAAGDDHAAAQRLETELWRYYEERSAVAPIFKEAARIEGLRRTSMRNLAELLIRLWTEPRPKKQPSTVVEG
jgi:hypothetical protein